MQSVVEFYFNDFIKTKLASKKDVMNFILNHERKSLCIQKVCEQIRITELNPRVKMNQEKLRSITESCARMFCDSVLKHAEEKALSRVETLNRIQKADQFKELEKIFDEDQKETPNAW